MLAYAFPQPLGLVPLIINEVIMQHYLTLLPHDISIRFMLMLQCGVTGCMVSLSLVSALCNFSERGGSQHFIHIYFNVQVINYKSNDNFNIMLV